MSNSLRIEIETESEEGLYDLLNKVVAEITLGPRYQLEGRMEDKFLVVDGPLKGRYNWAIE